MMDWTTSQCRQFHRLLSSEALLYSEMVTTGALLHGNTAKFLEFDATEHPISLQLGGHNAKDLAKCAQLAVDYGYDEVNLNAGCPSDRVQNGMIGAILMEHSKTVNDALKAMLDAVDIPVTIKHRIGIDDNDSYEFMRDFVGEVAKSGCMTFIVHARKAILQGLSPKENREIPPLEYDKVLRLKADFPDLNIVINGGIKDHQTGLELIAKGLDGVMLGREAYQNPLILMTVDSQFYQQQDPILSFEQLNLLLNQWILDQTESGLPLKYLAKHMLGLYSGKPGSKKFRRHLSENMNKPDADAQVFADALAMIKIG